MLIRKDVTPNRLVSPLRDIAQAIVRTRQDDSEPGQQR
jgi:hypothetical protein